MKSKSNDGYICLAVTSHNVRCFIKDLMFLMHKTSQIIIFGVDALLFATLHEEKRTES